MRRRGRGLPRAALPAAAPAAPDHPLRRPRRPPPPQARWRDLAWGFAPRWEDPPRSNTHHDYTLREVRWLANDFAQVRGRGGRGCLAREGGWRARGNSQCGSCARRAPPWRAVRPAALPQARSARPKAPPPAPPHPLSPDPPQERLWRRHAALKFARAAAAAARERFERLAQPAREAAAAAKKAAAAAHKAAAAGSHAPRSASKRGAAAKQRESRASAAAAAADGKDGDGGSGGGAEPSLVSGRRVTLSDEEKAALRADLKAAETAEAAAAYGARPRRGCLR
jgi:hypothetical protein